jgi:hypothetical protein
MMALGALHAGAEEELCDILHLLLHVFDLTIPGDGRVLIEIACCGDDLAYELVEGFVVDEGVVEPLAD